MVALHFITLFVEKIIRPWIGFFLESDRDYFEKVTHEILLNKKHRAPIDEMKGARSFSRFCFGALKAGSDTATTIFPNVNFILQDITKIKHNIVFERIFMIYFGFHTLTACRQKNYY